ncbi:EAL domain-containing protein [Paraglaciecola aquimarina]|uniref:EAL domain-containing protein n=1 Tax=Paraglaciecola algarum TaxID=3050085 RepID=A0ABS9D5M5_9ALTE|nr:bifunctional diguanylate cyclase/phosphodiesterase [Paraglaciecola sp. G1-23]MCF2947124.1 EAL domain-containing protein [Paraglaciecola sp. G1-23]
MKPSHVGNIVAHQYVTNDPLHQLFDAVNVISVQGYDEERRVIYWNKGSELIYGYTQEEATGKKLENLIIPKPMQELVIKAHREWIKNDIEIPAAELTLRHKNGNDVCVFSSHVLFTNQYNVKQMYCIDIDLAEVRQAQEQATFKQQMLETIFTAIPDLFFLMADDGTIIDYHVNNEQNLYVLPEHFIGKNIAISLPKNVGELFISHIEEVKQQKSIVSFNYELTMPHGQIFYEARLSHLAKYDQVIAIIRDITEQQKAADLIRHQAYFDSLTNLPNRFLSLDRLNQMLSEAKRNQRKTAILFLDIDDFKKINDTLGHEIGDKLLVQSAKRLSRVLRSDDTVGRLGGDEFIVLLKDLSSQEAAMESVESLLKAFRSPFTLDGRELMLTISIGIAIFPENGTSSSDLIRNADTAMYQAKASGRNTYSFFTDEMNTIMQRRFQLEEQMHGALERNEFEVYYQPQYTVLNQEIIGAEALLRWNNNSLGNITPDEFIPIAEHTGLIVPIGRYVIKQALTFLNQWQKQNALNYSISVNLSPRQFRDPGLVNFIKSTLKETHIAASCLNLEITEGVLMSGQSYIYQAISKLKKLGVKLAMDDFGTGYSSLNYLRQYPFDELKIDRSFIQGISENKPDCDLVKATIAMSHSLGLTVVAEGVETNEQLTLLQDMGCNVCQGYLLNRPLTIQQLLKLPK